MLLNNSNEIKAPSFGQSLVRAIYYCFIHHAAPFPECISSKGSLSDVSIQMEQMTSSLTASLMWHAFRNGCWLKWSWTEKPILTNGPFPVFRRDTEVRSPPGVCGQSMPFPKVPSPVGHGRGGGWRHHL